jgi:WD40 repeat protein
VTGAVEAPESQPADAASTAGVDAFPSLQALRAAHLNLLQAYGNYPKSDVPRTFLDEVEVFLERGQRAGTFIELQSDRRAAQNLLDYWCALLYRYGSTRSVAILASFDAARAENVQLEDTACPYPGPRPFTEQGGDRFFGRDVVVTNILHLLANSRVVAVTGAAGSGKTSLIRAGLLPALQAGGLDGREHWQVFTISLGTNPADRVVRALQPDASNDQLADSATLLRADPRALISMLSGEQACALWVDQLEELYAASPAGEADDRLAVLAGLESLARAESLPNLRILVTARFDDYAPAYSDVLVPATARIDMPSMGVRELSDAILQPAEQVGLKFDESVPSDLVQTLIGVPSVLPLLQFTLLELWDRRQGNRITKAAFQDALWDDQLRRPNAGTAIARKAERIYSQLPADEQAVADQILDQLVEPGQGWDVELKSVRISQLQAECHPAEAVDRIVQVFEDARLFRRSSVDAGDSTRIELTHAALPRYWSRLIDLLDARRHELRQRRRLRETAEQWQERHQDRTLLWKGLLLQETLEKHYPDLTEVEREFLHQSLEIQQAAKRRQRILFVLVFGALVCALAFGLVQALRTGLSGSLAASAQTQVAARPDQAMLTALRAYAVEVNPATSLGLLATANHIPDLATVLGYLDQSSDAPTMIAIDPAGDAVALRQPQPDGTATIDLLTANHATPQTLDPAQSFRALAFDPAGGVLMTVAQDGTLGYWDSTSRGKLPPPAGLPSQLPAQVSLGTGVNLDWLAIGRTDAVAAAISDTGRASDPSHPVRIYLWSSVARAWSAEPLTFSSQGAAKLWFSQNGQELFAGCTAGVGAAAANCTGPLVAWALGPDGNWAAENLDYLGPSMMGVHSISVGAGRLALSHGTDVELWDREAQSRIPLNAGALGSPAEPAQQAGDAATQPLDVIHVALSPDESLLAISDCNEWRQTGGAPNCAQAQIGLWSTRATDQALPLPPPIVAHTGLIRELAFTAVPGRIVSVGPEGALAFDITTAPEVPRMWPNRSGAPTLPPTSLIALDALDRFVAIAEGGAVSIWTHHEDGSYTPLTSVQTSQAPRSLALAGDGSTFARGEAGGQVVLSDAKGSATLPRFPNEPNPDAISAVDFSGSGSLLAAGGTQGDVAVWDRTTSSWRSITEGAVGHRAVTAIAISPDGQLVAAGGCGSMDSSRNCLGGQVTLSEVAHTDKSTRLPMAGQGSVVHLAFNADHTLLAAIGQQGTINVWHVDTGTLIQQFHGLPNAAVLRFDQDDTLQVMDQHVVLRLRLTDLAAAEQRACAVAQWTAARGAEEPAFTFITDVPELFVLHVSSLLQPLCTAVGPS